MWTNLALWVNPKKISAKIFFALAAAVLIGGFFVLKMALADSVFTVSVDSPEVDIGQTKSIAFTLDAVGAATLKTIAVSVQGSDFSEPVSFVCPAGWSQISAMPPISNGYICDDPTDTGLSSATITLNGLTAPLTAGNRNFSVSAINFIEQSENKSVSVLVKNLSANITIDPVAANTGQQRAYTFAVTNNGEDAITEITGVLEDFAINNCSATGWPTCDRSVNNTFSISGGALSPGASLDITVIATAPGQHGDYNATASITGSLGGERTASVTPPVIQVQVPAFLIASAISADRNFISNVSGAHNTTLISILITNTGGATANNFVKSLVIKNSVGNDISTQFNIAEIDTVNTLASGASSTLTWTVTANGTAIEGIDQAEITVQYDDSNDADLDLNVNRDNSSIFTVDNTAPTLNITAPAVGNIVNASAVIAFENDSNATPLEAECSVNNTNWTVCTTGVTALGSISEFDGLLQGTFTLYIKDSDLAGNTGVDQENGIIKDTIAPAFSAISALPSPAKSGTLITINFTSSETLAADPVVTIGGGTATKDISSAPPVYVYKRTLDGTETQGAAVISITGTDLAGNTGTNTTGTIILDFVAPNTTDNAPTGWRDDDAEITLTPTDPNPSSGLAWTKYCIDTTNNCAPAGGTTYSSTVTISDEGTKYFRYASQDNAGNLQTTVSKEIKIDKSNPASASVDSILPFGSYGGDKYVRGAVNINASAVDSLSNIAKVEFWYASTDTKIGEDIVAPYSMSWNTALASNNEYDVYVIAYDNAGNHLQSADFTVTVDNTPPTITSYELAVGGLATTTVDSVSFSPNSDGIKDTVTIDVAFSEYVEADINIKNSAGTTIKHFYNSNNVMNPEPRIWTGDGATGDGIYTIEVIGTDHAGNVVANTAKTITRDNTPPSVEAGSDKIVNTEVLQNATASDDGSGIALYLWTKDSGTDTVTFGTATAEDTTINADTDGERILRLTVTDNAGNINSDTMSFTRDTIAPNAVITSPLADEVVKQADGNVSLGFNSTGGTTCEYKVDGGSYLPLANCSSPKTINLTDGRRSVILKVTDAAGNSAESSAVSFVVDTNNTLTVGSSGVDFADIQTAINKATSGDTISIAAGTFNETVTVNKILSVVGAGVSTIIQPVINQNGIIITADNVLIKDLKVSTSNSGVSPNIAISVQEADNVEIYNNAIETSGDKAMGVWIGGVGYANSHNLQIIGNTITINGQATGIYAEGGSTAQSGWEIKSNTITAVTSNPLELYDVSDSEVSGNTLTINTPVDASTVMWFSELANLSDLIFKDNIISGSSGSEVAIGTDFRNDGPFIGSPATSITGITITGNTFSNWGTRALRLGKVGIGTVTDITVNNNKFLSTGVLLHNFDVAPVDAEANWWGIIDPAAINANIIGAVDYRPWYLSEALSGLDSASPTPVISSSETSPTNALPIPFTIDFGEAVTEFTVDDIAVVNGTAGNFSGSGAIYTFEVTPAGDGLITINVAGDICQDLSGNLNQAASQFNIASDRTLPATPVIAFIAGDNKINNAEKSAVHVIGTAEADSVVSVTLSDGAITTAPVNGTATGGNYDIIIDASALSDGIITPNITATDAAGNVSAPAVMPTALKDAIAPQIAINNGTSASPIKTDDINLTITETNPSVSEYGFSADNICDATDVYGNAFASGADFSLAGDHKDYLCAKAIDSVGNETYLLVGQLNTDNTAPALSLASLFTGQTLTGGHVYPINWTAEDLNFSATPIKIEYSINNGANWLAVINATDNDGVYAWSVPTFINSSSAKIKITALDLAGNFTENQSSVFTVAYSEIVDTLAPQVLLNSQNSGGSFQAGSIQVITWTATDNITPASSIGIKLEYSIDGSSSWENIIAFTDNDGAYLWTVPNDVSPNCLVRVTATDAVNNSSSDISNSVFGITAAPIHICSEAGNGNWTCDISLSQGWNLMSLPVIISTTTMADVLSGISANVDIVKYYYTASSSWLSYKPGFGGGLTAMEDGKGYWINMINPATLTVTGRKAPLAPALPKTYSVDSGWNLIGFKSTITQPTPTYLQSLPLGGYTLLNAGNENKTSGFMDAGQGYWLWMNANGSIATYSE